MRSCLVVIRHIGLHNLIQLTFIEGEKVIQAFASDTAEQAFTDGIRLWRAIGRFQYFNSAGVCDTGKGCPELAVIIPNQALGMLTKRGGCSQLLGDPRIGWSSGHPKLDNSPRVQLNDEVDMHHAEKQGVHRQEVARPNTCGMIVQKGEPLLRTRTRLMATAHLAHIFLHGALAEVYSKFAEFTANTLCAPNRFSSAI